MASRRQIEKNIKVFENEIKVAVIAIWKNLLNPIPTSQGRNQPLYERHV